MGKNLQPLFGFRTKKEYIDKLDVIAETNSRNRNKQIEYLIKQCIKEFELENGEIQLNNSEE